MQLFCVKLLILSDIIIFMGKKCFASWEHIQITRMQIEHLSAKKQNDVALS